MAKTRKQQGQTLHNTTKIVVGRLNYLLFWAARQIARLASLNNRQKNNRNSQDLRGVEPELFAAAAAVAPPSNYRMALFSSPVCLV